MEQPSRWISSLRRWMTILILFTILLAPVYSADADTPEPPEEAIPDETNLPQINAVSTTSDEYGYSIAGVTYDWIDLRTGLDSRIDVTYTLTLPSLETYSGQINLEFPNDFAFYENKYSQVRISKYGLLLFGDGIKAPLNQPIPFDTEPNNFIAPFWDNLVMVDGTIHSAIYYGLGYIDEEPIFVVEWKDLVFLGTNDRVQTFEVILFENGNILLQYQTLTDNPEGPGYTVGIENQQGTDGIQYIYNDDVLNDNSAYLITRPSPSPRVSLTPPFSSSFTENGTAWLEVTVSNTGNISTDPENPVENNFELILTDGGSWNYTFYHADGVTQLADTDHYNIPETGLIAEGSSLNIKVKVDAPNGSQPGYIRPTLTATSMSSGSVQDTTILQVAVPASFMQAYSNNTRMWSGGIWSENIYNNNLEFFPGYVFGIDYSTPDTYLYVWERGEDKFEDGVLTDYQNINYFILDSFGLPTPFGLPYRSVFDNEAITNLVDGYFYSRDPELTHLDSGAYGVAWAQEHMKKISDTVRHRNWNIEFALLNSGGTNITPSGTGKIAVTHNIEFIGESGSAPLFANPQIQASGNLLFISWLQTTYNGDESQTDVYYSVSNTAGITVTNPISLTEGIMGGKTYDTPSLVALNNSDVLVIYPEDTDGNGSSDKLVYQRIKSDGTVKDPQIITLADVKNVDSERLSNGNILVSWVDHTDALVHYVLLVGHDNNNDGIVDVITDPTALPASYSGDYRTPQYVSITHDQNGNAILTWNVNSPSDYLYYALIDSNSGAILTPPMRYLNGEGIYAANSSQGLVPYGGSFRVFLPLLARP